MWVYNSDYDEWKLKTDLLKSDDFEYLKQEYSSYQLYSKCLSGAVYLPMNDMDNIYDILSYQDPKNWYISSSGSQYTDSPVPNNDSPIDLETSYDYFKNTSEYSLTLKSLFTPERIIKDSLDNLMYVDVATIKSIDDLSVTDLEMKIDGIRLKEGHLVLVKDQDDVIDNGIYKYENNRLNREDILDEYENCIRFAVSVKLGDSNREKQYNLLRLSNGYFPTTSKDEDIEFD